MPTTRGPTAVPCLSREGAASGAKTEGVSGNKAAGACPTSPASWGVREGGRQTKKGGLTAHHTGSHMSPESPLNAKLSSSMPAIFELSISAL